MLSRSALLTATTLLLTVCLGVTAGPTHADPPNMAPVPADVPERIDALIPAPTIPSLTTIPARSVTPGASHELQELREAIMPDPSGDAFFDRWPAAVKTAERGTIFATRDIATVAAPLLKTSLGTARQIKFATRDAVGRPSFGTATLFVPPTRWSGPGARPIMINNPPIVALGTKCTTGYTLAHGRSDDTNGTDLKPETTQDSLKKGYAVIVPDHTGHRTAYAEPYTAAHVVLDSVRAAATLDPTNFARGPIAMLGYSGGAIATNGTVKLAADYAPDIAERFVGAAIGGLPADYRVLAGAMNANLATGLFHAGILGITRERPELLPMANNLARQLAVNPTLKNLCNGSIGYLGLTFGATQLLSTDPDPFNSAAAQKIFGITEMAGKKSPMPLYFYHGAQEWWIPEGQARAVFDEQCGLGVNATFRSYPGEHMSTVFTGYPDAVQWLFARLSGKAPVDGCPRR